MAEACGYKKCIKCNLITLFDAEFMSNQTLCGGVTGFKNRLCDRWQIFNDMICLLWYYQRRRVIFMHVLGTRFRKLTVIYRTETKLRAMNALGLKVFWIYQLRKPDKHKMKLTESQSSNMFDFSHCWFSRDWLSPSPPLWSMFHWCLNCKNHLLFCVLRDQINL